MIDLIPVEVYAYESEKLLAEGADERTSGYCPADTTDSDRSAIGHECKVQATSRLIRTIQVSDLPPVRWPHMSATTLNPTSIRRIRS